MCTKLGPVPVAPSRGAPGYARYDPNFSGLCAVACSDGTTHCPTAYCDMVVHGDLQAPAVSAFTPSHCTAGTGTGDLKALCEYGFKYGHCPIKAPCVCIETGGLRTLPAAGTAYPGVVHGSLSIRLLCEFACKYGYCKPDGVCNPLPPAPSPWAGGFWIYRATQIFLQEAPDAI